MLICVYKGIGVYKYIHLVYKGDIMYKCMIDGFKAL